MVPRLARKMLRIFGWPLAQAAVHRFSVTRPSGVAFAWRQPVKACDGGNTAQEDAGTASTTKSYAATHTQFGSNGQGAAPMLVSIGIPSTLELFPCH